MPVKQIYNIGILPIRLSPLSLRKLSSSISKTFNLQTEIIEKNIDLKKTYSPVREQYDSMKILKQIITDPKKEDMKILGVTEVDLFIPVLTFVFGEAQLDGIGAVVSMRRMNEKYYGLPENNTLLNERLKKEAIHELGHTFGLLHCSTPYCVMNSSTYVEDIDRKGSNFCLECRERLELYKMSLN